MNLATILMPRSRRQIQDGMRVVNIPSLGAYDLSVGPNTQNKRFIRSPWAYACMDIRGSELANLPWRLVDEAGKIVTSHPLIDILNQFGEESNYYESMRATEIDLLMSGKGFWLKDVDQLQRLNAGSITLKRDRTGIQEFVQTVEGVVVNRFPRKDVVYFREFNPDNDLDPGPSVMTIVEKAVAIEYEAGLYAEAFFKNDATPSILVSTDQAVQQPEMDRIKEWWAQTFKGSRKAHKTAFADKGMKAQILSTSMKDIALTDIRTRAQNDICAGFRVPKILVGAMEEATYANAQEARRFMLEDVVIPRSAYFADVINADLVRPHFPGVRFEFAPRELPILQEGANEMWKRLESAITARAISPEFARKLMGWPETAAPPAAPPPQTAPEQIEARAWLRKARKALASGKGADVPFECHAIGPERQAAIRAELATAGLDDLEVIFQ